MSEGIYRLRGQWTGAEIPTIGISPDVSLQRPDPIRVTAQLKPIVATYDLDKGAVVLGINALAPALVLMLNLVSTGTTRPFWGWLSDHIGRYNTMAMASGRVPLRSSPL